MAKEASRGNKPGDNRTRETSEVLLEMARLTAGPLGMDEVLHRIAGFALRVFKVDGAVIFLYDGRARTITPAAAAYAGAGNGLVEENIALRLHEDSVFSLALEAEGVYALAGEQLQRRDILDLSGPGALRLVPLRADTGTLGLLALANRHAQDTYDRDLTHLLSAVASLAAVIIAKARLIDNLERSEEKYRNLTENASDIVFSLDSSGRFTFLNSRVKDVLGYAPQDLLGTYFSGIVTPESWQQTISLVRRALAEDQGFLAYRWEALHHNGRRVTLDVSASVLRVHGEFQGQQGIARDMSESQRLARELARRDRDLQVSQRRQSELRDYLALVTQVQEEERRRISRELHDDTAQALVALGRRLDLCRELLPAHPDLVSQRLSELAGLVDVTLENLRRYCRELRPSILDDLGLLPALEWLLGGLSEYQVHGRLDVQGQERRLPAQTEVAVFRIVQEALNNVKQHAGPCQVDLAIMYTADRLSIAVTDDGVGFDRTKTGHGSGRLGLVGMNERAALLGGVLKVTSAPGKGTSVHLDLPI
ncbi:MAG: PAS domain S-box protein [Bacillota bacterium]